MTLSQLKRDLKVGDKVLMIKMIHSVGGKLEDVAICEKLEGVRTVTLVNTTGWYFANEGHLYYGKRGSWCGYPKAKDLQYFKDKNIFEITDKENDGKIWGVRTYKIIK